MKRAYINGILLDGTQHMEPQAHKVLLCEDGVITAVADEGTDLDGYEVIDLHGGYAMPGLINLHVHLAGNGKPSAKPRDNAALVRKILSNGLTRAVAYRMVCSYAKLELLGGVTTIRTVGGIADFDTRCRDDAQAGKILAPRILAANEGISVPGGHMAGSVAVAAHNNGEALTQLTKASTQRVDLVKLMITGGVLDAAEKGTPGELKMPPEMVKAVCDQAHAMGYPVAAHTESPEGVKAALENGVDSIEHGAKMDEETVKLYKEHGAFLCTTISPALPYALFDTAVSGASEKDQYNGRIVFDGIVESAKTALANGIPVGLGNDVGCPYITQYDFWRELCYFHKYCGVSNQFALYTATLRNARLAGSGQERGPHRHPSEPAGGPAGAAASGAGGLPGPRGEKARAQAQPDRGQAAGPLSGIRIYPRKALPQGGAFLHARHDGQNALPAFGAGAGGGRACRTAHRRGLGLRLQLGGSRYSRVEEHLHCTALPPGGQLGSLRVGLQGAALGSGQAVGQPVQDGGHRQAGGLAQGAVAPVGTPAHKAVHRDDGPGAGVTGQRQIAVRARQRFQLLHHAVGAGSVQPVLAAAGVEVGVLQQALGLGGELPGELAALVVAEHPPLAEQLEVQSSAAHRGVTHGGAVLPGHPPDFQVSVVAAEILQAHGGQKLRPRQTG